MTSADGLARTVLAWLESLDPGRRSRACFPFETAERFVWAYTPVIHEGLALGDMTPAQRAAAVAILDASLSARSAGETRAVIELETVLGEVERSQARAGWQRRDPSRYWFGVFGDPSSTDAPWSWRLGGHHVNVHVTVVEGVIASTTPSFLGANPAVVPSGRTAGSRVLTGEETLARELLLGLDTEQRSIAIVNPVAPPDILSGTGRRPGMAGMPAGIARRAMDAAGQDRFDALVRHYLGRAREDVAAATWDRLVVDGLAHATFAWAGPTEPGRGHYYAVRGGSMLLEYDNTQNGANHIHAVWHDVEGDWGDDVLAAHYRTSHAG